jgi:hypothetical protein
MISLVYALGVAQSDEVRGWCDIFRGPREAMARHPNGLEMRRAAVDIVFKYTGIYGEYCR